MPKKSRKRADGRYVSTLTINGKRKSFYSTVSQTEANRARDKYKSEQIACGMLGNDMVNNRVRMDAWAKRWLQSKEMSVKASSYASSYQRPTEQYIIPTFGNRYVADIKPLDIDDFMTAMSKKYSASTLQKTRLCLNSIFNTAIDNGICIKNPCKNINAKSKKVKNEKHTYTREQTDKILEYCKTDPYGIYIRLLLELGLRCSELCGLKWSDFDLKSKTVQICRAATDSNGATVIDLPKSSESRRTLPISTALSQTLEQYPVGKDQYVVQSTRTPDVPVNPKNFSAKRYNTFFNRFISRLPKEEAKVFPRLTPHELRHTCGTLLYQKTKNIYAVSKYLGHSDVSITAKLYVHNDTNTLRESLNID